MNTRGYIDFLQDIEAEIKNLEDFIRGIDFEEFKEDRKTINACIRSLEVIGEAAKNLPAEVKKKNPQIPWQMMAKMRDKLIHGYFGLDHIILYTAVKEDIPPLKKAVRKMISSSRGKK